MGTHDHIWNKKKPKHDVENSFNKTDGFNRYQLNNYSRLKKNRIDDHSSHYKYTDIDVHNNKKTDCLDKS